MTYPKSPSCFSLEPKQELRSLSNSQMLFLQHNILSYNNFISATTCPNTVLLNIKVSEKKHMSWPKLPEFLWLLFQAWSHMTSESPHIFKLQVLSNHKSMWKWIKWIPNKILSFSGPSHASMFLLDVSHLPCTYSHCSAELTMSWISTFSICERKINI